MLFSIVSNVISVSSADIPDNCQSCQSQHECKILKWVKFFERKRALFVILHTGGLLYFVVRQNLSQIYAFFSVKFPGLKICECNKMTNLRYGYECRVTRYFKNQKIVIKICLLDCHKKLSSNLSLWISFGDQWKSQWQGDIARIAKLPYSVSQL